MKITITEFVTLDGVCQGPFVRQASAWLDLADGLLLGRRTYEAFARDWPQITDPDDPFTTR